MFWLIVQATNEPSESITALTEALTFCKQEFEVITFKAAYESDLSRFPDATFVYAPVSIARYLIDQRDSWIDLMPLREMRVSHYSAYIYSHMFNKGYFLPLGILEQTTRQFPTLDVFVRPDANTKIFTAGLYNNQDLKDLLRALEPETMCYFAESKEILAEYRCLVKDGKYITGSCYKAIGEDSNLIHCQHNVDGLEDIKAYVESVPSIPGFPNTYFIDVARTKDRDDNLFVLEFSSLNAAGFYACDLNKIIETVDGLVCLEF